MLFEFDQRLEIGLLIKQRKIASGNFNLEEAKCFYEPEKSSEQIQNYRRSQWISGLESFEVKSGENILTSAS